MVRGLDGAATAVLAQKELAVTGQLLPQYGSVDYRGFEALVSNGGRGELHVAEGGFFPPESRTCGGISSEGEERAAFIEVGEKAGLVEGGVGI